MSEHTTEAEVIFTLPFVLNALAVPLPSGTYRLIVNEGEADDRFFPAHRKTKAYLEIPSLGTAIGRRQRLLLSPGEIETALAKDKWDNTMNRSQRQAQFNATNQTAAAIVARQQASRDAKTARLRDLRLMHEAAEAAKDAASITRGPRKRKPQ